MKQRVITGLLLAIGAIAALFAGGLVLNVLVGIVCLLGIKEVLDVCQKDCIPKTVKVYCFVAGLMMYLCYPNQLLLPSHVFMLFILGLYICVVLFEHFKVEDAFMLISMLVLVITGIRGIYTITNQHGYLSMLYVALATFGCDTGAYFAGYFFGKHKLIERISPKKTIEGSIGGMAVGTILASVFAMVAGLEMPVYEIWLLAFVLTITSQFGDLTFSALKRHYGIKDFSNLLPGHGGVLDRIDSLIFNVIVYLIWFVFFI